MKTATTAAGKKKKAPSKPKPKKPSTPYVDILFILDRSGSMASIAEDAVGGVNAFLAEQRKEPEGKRFAMIQFDDRHESWYDYCEMDKVQDLVLGKSYVPRASTALLDAIGFGVSKLIDRNPDRAVIAIYTDGMENSSVEWTRLAVSQLLKQAEERDWEVMFLASDLGAANFARKDLGVHSDRVAHAGREYTGATMRTMSARTTGYYRGASGQSMGSVQGTLDAAIEAQELSDASSAGTVERRRKTKT